MLPAGKRAQSDGSTMKSQPGEQGGVRQHEAIDSFPLSFAGADTSAATALQPVRGAEPCGRGQLPLGMGAAAAAPHSSPNAAEWEVVEKTPFPIPCTACCSTQLCPTLHCRRCPAAGVDAQRCPAAV